MARATALLEADPASALRRTARCWHACSFPCQGLLLLRIFRTYAGVFDGILNAVRGMRNASVHEKKSPGRGRQRVRTETAETIVSLRCLISPSCFLILS